MLRPFAWPDPHALLTCRVAWLSLVAGCVGLCGISFMQRSILRLLLNYRGWMWLGHGQRPSILTKGWFFAVKMLSGGKPSLFNFQGCLPRLPVPSLKQTCSQYLLTVKPLLSEEEYADMEGKVKKFLKEEGWKLQLFLKVRTLYTVSWLWEWWEKYVYLRGRSPIMINSNYYILDSCYTQTTYSQVSPTLKATRLACHLQMAWPWCPRAFVGTFLTLSRGYSQPARAAALIIEAFKFKRLIDWEQVRSFFLWNCAVMGEKRGLIMKYLWLAESFKPDDECSRQHTL